MLYYSEKIGKGDLDPSELLNKVVNHSHKKRVNASILMKKKRKSVDNSFSTF